MPKSFAPWIRKFDAIRHYKDAPDLLNEPDPMPPQPPEPPWWRSPEFYFGVIMVVAFIILLIVLFGGKGTLPL